LSTSYNFYFNQLVKQRLNVNYDSCNTLHPPVSAYGIHVLSEGNRIKFLLA